ncbi:hypothetical protein BABINDRAFT_158983 [Babjeviella inositovora NRRL Y-12698]|uniref:Major facilitator superfamily (MFS) profile domain-containing protein n=1 Tax=Babjeviella inositovora NRRL Y-12698 TaxID=984486 RepID=A0A1E3QXJ9_9ASCO|nr:uncharacterized protein BABINDRAFT_158983 [Babjeviella inositovora NRRL Y-12698]ODQ82376.1 hypothetical protein BABINDRAFT_158983 [Babjeviella inositovora NRRL Y-12698]
MPDHESIGLSSNDSYKNSPQNPITTSDIMANDTAIDRVMDKDPVAFVGDPEKGRFSGDDMDRIESNDEASRMMSRALTGSQGIEEAALADEGPLPAMGNGKPYPKPVGDRAPYAVAFDGPNDPTHPHNWPTRTKVLYSLTIALATVSITFGSAMFSTATEVISRKFHIGEVTATLSTSLYVLGFASGPIIWAPLSELYGRKIVLIPSCFGFVCFNFAVGTARDIQTIMICRFFAGFIGAAPMVVVPAALADMFNAEFRGTAMNLFSMTVFGGPLLAPVIGGFIMKNSHMGWRWTCYITGLVGILSLLGIVFFLEETHHPLILVQKARVLRRRTGNWGIHAPHEEFTISFKELAEKNITRPLIMLFTEPILLFISIYNAFIYGLLYLFLTAYPLIFAGGYGFGAGEAELPYVGMLIGMFIGGLMCMWWEQRFKATLAANGGKPIPEERLPPMMVGSIVFAGGIFWLCWAGNYPDKVHWIVPTIGGAPIGFGLISIFLPCINYLVDCYLIFAASALAGNTFLRSTFGAVFPLFATQMFKSMGINWAGTLLGCVALVLVPVPFLFYKYGPHFRARSKYAFLL